MSRLDWHSDTRRHAWLASFTGLIAILAYAGAVAVATGVLGPGVEARLPFESPVFAGVALAVVVGVPMTVVTTLGLRGDARTSAAAVVAGALLIAWIAVEVGFVRTYSWLQPVFAFAGVAVLHTGLQGLRGVRR
ncbi:MULTISPECIES: hypothetical protein [Amycolatopsis]|uniref:Uncharacterized protein n=2 Tax=Amycolatopsis TaxID=1813 RepID=A0A1I3KZE4_9PSEU|nr:hypothetical protein [Amycolatopsis sacchari]SFI77708.1 hypothetical protein SAMN05421835_101750 [Amycolatopsis sacchari]